MPLLDIKNLRTTFSTQVGQVRAVRGLNLTVDYGESVGIVGESGSGKSVSMLSVMGLLPVNAHVNADSIMFDGRELTTMDEREKRKMHGSEIGMVFQDPMTSLNPLHTIGMQLMEPIKLHMGLNKAQARARALEMLKLVNIPSPESRLKQYPHEFSGGMRQRVMIAIALACNPKLIIADEPTTALDVTIQAQILELMQGLKNRAEYLDHNDNPRSGRNRQHVQPHSRNVRRLRGRNRHHARDILFAQAPVHMGSVALHTQGADGRNPFQTPANTRHAA